MSGGKLPAVGQVVRLDAAASVEYVCRPFNLLLTDPPALSSVDAAEGRAIRDARRLLLTGWELNSSGQKVVLRRALPARRKGIAIVSPPAARRPALHRQTKQPPRPSWGG